jgi:SAM-dependent methyltransferase
MMMSKANAKYTNSNATLNWTHHALGQYVCAQEQVLYDAWVSNLFGYHALQLGVIENDFLRNCRIQHSFHAQGRQVELLCDSAFLPFPEQSLDLVLLPHVLEFSLYPQQSLREVERVLMPEGHVMLTVFNPISPWGMRRSFGCGKSDIPDLWQAKFFSMPRIRDWLALLGFEVVNSQILCHAWPIHSTKIAQRFSWAEQLGLKYWPMMGGVYAILARKRVTGMHIIKPTWQNLNLSKKLVSSANKKHISERNQ